MRGGDWHPSYAASVVQTAEFTPASTFEINHSQAAEYFAGAAIRLIPPFVEPTRSWNALTWLGRRIAWSKYTGGILKNHLPKALRKTNLRSL
jgi:NOL1/NOP2/fmu family ribosome biogenesis protein